MRRHDAATENCRLQCRPKVNETVWKDPANEYIKGGVSWSVTLLLAKFYNKTVNIIGKKTFPFITQCEDNISYLIKQDKSLLREHNGVMECTDRLILQITSHDNNVIV